MWGVAEPFAGEPSVEHDDQHHVVTWPAVVAGRRLGGFLWRFVFLAAALAFLSSPTQPGPSLAIAVALFVLYLGVLAAFVWRSTRRHRRHHQLTVDRDGVRCPPSAATRAVGHHLSADKIAAVETTEVHRRQISRPGPTNPGDAGVIASHDVVVVSPAGDRIPIASAFLELGHATMVRDVVADTLSLPRAPDTAPPPGANRIGGVTDAAIAGVEPVVLFYRFASSRDVNLMWGLYSFFPILMTLSSVIVLTRAALTGELGSASPIGFAIFAVIWALTVWLVVKWRQQLRRTVELSVNRSQIMLTVGDRARPEATISTKAVERSSTTSIDFVDLTADVGAATAHSPYVMAAVSHDNHRLVLAPRLSVDQAMQAHAVVSELGWPVDPFDRDHHGARANQRSSRRLFIR